MAETTEKAVDGCTVQIVDVYGQPYCQEPPTTAVVAGCVNEHLDEDRLCSRHLDLLKDGWLVCVTCRAAGHQEQVSLLAEILPSGERVRVLNGATT